MRVSYWTTACLEPQIEAVSKEVYDLFHGFPGSRVLAVSPHLGLRVMEGARVVGIHAAAGPYLRPLFRLAERRGNLNHIYSELAPWVFFSGLRHRPIVLTIASEKGDVVPEYLGRCAAIAVQTESMYRQLERVPEAAGRVHLVYPGIDLRAFSLRSGVRVGQRPRILMATFPRAAEELRERGIEFLLDAATALPEMDFTFVSRPWRSGSSALGVVQSQVATRRLANVTILSGVQADMGALYRQSDFTVIPLATAAGGKECPRSLVESMACGVPVLISSAAPFSSFVSRQGAGEVFDMEVQSFAAALERGVARYTALSTSAAAAVRQHFDVNRTRAVYRALYEQALHDA